MQFKPITARSRVANILHHKFGKLTIIGIIGVSLSANKTYWLARCSCGNFKQASLTDLKDGSVISCGCARVAGPCMHDRDRRGRKRQSTTHNIWSSMIKRCGDPRATNFYRYGERGITVCERWINSFQAFLEDMGPRPSLRHTLDRKNNDGPYSPDNCRWATFAEQSRNKSSNHNISFDGRTMCLEDWATEIGIDSKTLRKRLKRWPLQRALTEQSHHYSKRKTAA